MHDRHSYDGDVLRVYSDVRDDDGDVHDNDVDIDIGDVHDVDINGDGDIDGGMNDNEDDIDGDVHDGLHLGLLPVLGAEPSPRLRLRSRGIYVLHSSLTQIYHS